MPQLIEKRIIKTESKAAESKEKKSYYEFTCNSMDASQLECRKKMRPVHDVLL